MQKRHRTAVLTILLTIPTTVMGYWFYTGPKTPVQHLLPGEPMDVAVDDITGDGNSDVIVASRSGRALTVFSGNGEGGLQKHSEIHLAQGATSVVVTNLNQDNDPDLAVTVCDEDCTHSGILLFTGSGGGHFDSPVDFAIPGTPSQIVAADFNNDGRTDLATSNLAVSLVSLLISKDSTEFDLWNLPTDEPPTSISVADCNNDSLPDIATVNKRSRSVSIFLNTPLEEDRFARRDLFTGTIPTDVEFQDFNGDKNIDLAVAHATQPGQLSIYWGAGNGYFKKKKVVKTENLPISILGRDFNGDGFQDLLVTRKQKSFAVLHLNEGKGKFLEKPFRVRVGSTISDLELGYINGDSVPDMATLSYESNSLSVSLGVRSEGL